MLTMDKIEAPHLAGLKLSQYPEIAVIGAYKGDTVAFIREYHPDAYVYAYEPQRWAADKLIERFEQDDHVYIYPYGLGAGSRSDVLLYEHDTDAASVLELPGYRTLNTVELLDASELTKHPRLDLIFMNIEGYEYTLIPYMLGLDILPKYWMIQWHFAEKYRDGYGKIFQQLAGMRYLLTFIGKGWELWTRI